MWSWICSSSISLLNFLPSHASCRCRAPVKSPRIFRCLSQPSLCLAAAGRSQAAIFSSGRSADFSAGGLGEDFGDGPLFLQFLDAGGSDFCCPQKLGLVEGEVGDFQKQTELVDAEDVQENPYVEQGQEVFFNVTQSVRGLEDFSFNDEELDDLQSLRNEVELGVGSAVDLELDFLEEMFPGNRGLLTGRRVFSVGRWNLQPFYESLPHDEVDEVGHSEPGSGSAILSMGAGKHGAGIDFGGKIEDEGTELAGFECSREVASLPDGNDVEEDGSAEQDLSSKDWEYFVSAEPTDPSDGFQLLRRRSGTLASGCAKASDVEGLIQELLCAGKDVTTSFHDVMLPFLGKLTTLDGNYVIRRLGEAMHVRQAFALFEWMRSHDPCLVNRRSYSLILPVLGEAGMVEKAKFIFQARADDSDFFCVQVYNAYLGVLLSSGRQDDVDVLLSDMERKGIKRDSVTFSLMINFAVKEKRGLKEVLKLYDTMLHSGVPPNTSVFGSVVKAFCDERFLDEALLFVNEMKASGMPPNVIVYNTLIDAFGKAGKLDVAEWLLAEAKESGLKLHVSTYNVILNAYGRQGFLEVAENLLTEMKESGLKPDVVTYTTLINAYGKKKMCEKAASTFARMRIAGLVPNCHAYTALIHAYSESGWHSKASLTFESMKRVGITPTVQSYTSLLKGYRIAGEVEEVARVWGEMKIQGCQGTRITFNTLLDAFAKQGRFKEARDVVSEYTRLGYKPDRMTFNMLINAYGRGGNHERIPELVKEMRDQGLKPDSYTYCSVIYAFLRVRDFTSAFRWFDKMLHSRQKPDPATYEKLAAIVLEKRRIKKENDKKSVLGQTAPPKLGGKKQFWKTKQPLKASRARLKTKPKVR